MTGYFPSPIPSSTDGECLRSTHPLPATMFVGPQSCAIKQRVWARQAEGLGEASGRFDPCGQLGVGPLLGYGVVHSTCLNGSCLNRSGNVVAGEK
jgi:hypothetical protein